MRRGTTGSCHEKTSRYTVYRTTVCPLSMCQVMLKENGDFLVRMSEPSAPGKREFVLSTMFDKDTQSVSTRSHAEHTVILTQVKHFVIKNTNGKYSIDKTQFDSVNDLVKTHLEAKTSITQVCALPYSESYRNPRQSKEILIKTPVARRPWQLDHADVECTKKLGEGAFGEVRTDR